MFDEKMSGTLSGDELDGTIGDDLIHSGKGDDTVDGGAGDDKINSGKGDDTVTGGAGDDNIHAGQGDDTILDDYVLTSEDFNTDGSLTDDAINRSGNDLIQGGHGNDNITASLGADRVNGGQGDDIIISLSDSNTPKENLNIPAQTDDGNDIDKLEFTAEYYNPYNLEADDLLTGGAGADQFIFKLVINAPKDILRANADDNGVIDWTGNGVAGENGAYHDHWVDGIGSDTITDFSGQGGEGDSILITGHTITYEVIENDEINNFVSLGLYSDQGADGSRGGGAHDFDVVGVVNIYHDGNFNLGTDVTVNAGVFYGAFETI